MKFCVVFQIVLCIVSTNKYSNALNSEEVAEVTETCCTHGEALAMISASAKECAGAGPPDEIEPEQSVTCLAAMTSCCDQHFRNKEECTAGMALAPAKRCSVPKSDVGKTCCEECSFGRLTGESQGKDACGGPAGDYASPSSALRKNAYYQCCVEAAEKPETTTEKRVETTIKKRVQETCKTSSCDHNCDAINGKVICSCREGYRLQGDKKTCKDINECAEAIDDVCTTEGTVCHNTAGSFKCVPIKKRDVGITCPAGFKRNVQNQVCDDINECQLPRPPCPKYLCENTIGGYKCGGKPGKPFEEAVPGATTPPTVSTTAAKNDICPPGFRAGPDDECVDIEECEERLDDCQRLSQHCINTHGSYFCQDHVSKRCAPGFKVNAATGICEDIDECEESTEVCKRNEVCVNMPGAYTCKSKISTLPKLATKTCQEGTRIRPGGSICEDIDECREGSHLCDQFQNCINTFGGHECRCKNGFELDSSGSCVDVDECSLKLDNCREGTRCLNVLGSFTCTRQPATTTPAPAYEYEYYDSEEDNTTNEINETRPEPIPPTTSSTTTTPRPTQRPTTIKPTTSTMAIPTPPALPPRPTNPYPYPARTASTRRPYPNRPERPDSPNRPERPDTPERPDRPERPFRPDRPVRPDRPERPDSPERPDKPENPERPESPVRPDQLWPIRPTTTRRPEIPVTPKRIPTRRPERPVEVDVPGPRDPVTVEKETDPEGSYGIDSSDIPKDRWTNVIGKKRTERPEPGFDPNQVHCLNGYERNAQGDCVDINECEGNRHICSSLEVCVNREGGYVCDCMAGFHRDASGWCVTVTTTERTTTSTTESTTAVVASSPEWPYAPRPRGRPYTPPLICELGYTFDSSQGKCVDIDECATNKANCASNENCVNIEGGYRCQCTRACQPEPPMPNYDVVPSREPVHPDTNVITVGAQYGERGLRYTRPTFSRLPDSGAVVTACPWGYKHTPDKMCLDIDECAKNVSECGPQQRCENFYGGYSCHCPAGHRLRGRGDCVDIDECAYSKPCPYNAQCINTVGSYRCACGDGFRNAPSNEKVCVDVDECADTPGACEQGCANAWGGFRCYCNRGYRLHSDNRTCVDVDECAARRRACGGACVNTRGSYRCDCPAGYRLADDHRSCIDIDECESGVASCSHGEPGQVCQNTRGSYHCHRIACPSGYQLESKHRCTRIQRSCPVADWSCLELPSTYSYNFITFVANIYLPEGSVDLFTMHGPAWRDSMVNFEMRMVDVQATVGVKPADISCFDMRPSNNICVVSLVCSLGGPQVAELELKMSLYQRGQFAGSAVARLVVIVSQYDF